MSISLLQQWWQKTKALFTQGLSPRELSMSITVGVLTGLIPIIGITTIFITFLAFKYRINLAIALGITYFIIPIQLLCFIPFIRVGEYLLGAVHHPLSIESIKNEFSEDYVQAMMNLTSETGYGLLGWCVVCIPACFMLFLLLWKGFVVFKENQD